MCVMIRATTLFVVKTNQPELHRDIAIAFGDASPL